MILLTYVFIFSSICSLHHPLQALWQTWETEIKILYIKLMENVEEKWHINGREWSGEGERADRKKKFPLFRKSKFIQLFGNVTNVNISKKESVFIYLFLNKIQITEWGFSYKPPHISRGLSLLPFWPCSNASLLVVNSYALWLILGAFVVFHYKKKKKKKGSGFCFCVSLSPCLSFSTQPQCWLMEILWNQKVTFCCVCCQI